MLDLLAVQVNEATKILDEGVTDNPADIDTAIMNGTGNTMGVISLLKRIGKDKLIAICERYANELGVETFRPTQRMRDWE